ncbi:uncharacterized protein L969DRAFT_149293 [Mixia osmundae IAM 14324]|uniref:phosphatidylinositol-3,4,5-trisphosphate 3-phosphatase n=1 Tax=Mixia osmundae (strain CBS 9802 / IAM 14324 / JCM 22182 / KY 12970) TaxID=764103 RepID=G7E850_MIXOS|nr:uncharacterized protein L969DRAFT_149293 [Mixia osmundae IAM 14324]KEI42397.1 hypothetical protein L969DRAFT_149293 [Mixia osmundae IAM 14324]GAA99010.1 hypothetical protein E5Q_05699 [Mixia osmundae IAM 14324]
MSLNRLRTLVSGQKARLVQDGYDLDLCQLEPNLFIMGYPATGSESLYRNDRTQVKRWLLEKQRPFLVINLCPRCENAYPSDAFEPGQILRCPFPDHHPPLLSQYKLVTERMRDFYAEQPQGFVVIHCKAGKGRSGSMACAFLILRELLKPGSACESIPPKLHDAAEQSVQSILDYHTSRRMRADAKALGVSIPSQQRFLRYWARLCISNEAKEPVMSHRRVKMESVVLNFKSDAGKLAELGRKHLSVTLQTWTDAAFDYASYAAAEPGKRHDDWPDEMTMLQSVAADFVEQPMSDHDKLLVPKRAVDIDADRPVQVKLVMSSERSTKLIHFSDVLSLGYVWFIPSYAANLVAGESTEVRFGLKEIDFAKKQTGLVSLSVWLVLL